jgi:hypothetical protein
MGLNSLSWNSSVAAPFLLVLLFLTSCVIPIPIPIPPSPARIAAQLEPPEQYDHPYDGQVVERVMPEAEVRSVCMSMGLDLFTVACSWHSAGTCHIVLPNDGQAPIELFRRHEIAHCNGWPADHPRNGWYFLSSNISQIARHPTDCGQRGEAAEAGNGAQ